jgi:predicted phage replisome organizer
MTEVKWVKITTDMFDNRKIKHLRRLDNGDNLALIWVMLLTIAGRSNADGSLYLTEGMPYDAAMLSDELGFDEQTIDFALKTMVQLRMIIKEKGVFRIAGWEEYQNVEGMEKIKEQTRKRVAKHRDKKTLSDDRCNADVTQCNATEEEEEGEEEKEFHSFVHSQKRGFDSRYFHIKTVSFVQSGAVFLLLGKALSRDRHVTCHADVTLCHAIEEEGEEEKEYHSFFRSQNREEKNGISTDIPWTFRGYSMDIPRNVRT